MTAGVGMIEVPKSCDLLADRLRQQILAGGFAPGDPLPAERDLVIETGLSRGSVREALRILQAQGLVRTRPGRYGGSTVIQPTENLLASQVGSFARGRGVSFQALIETREALEPMLAQLAARNRSDADLAALDAISVRMAAAASSRPAVFIDENVNWHWALAEASHNDLLRAFMASITGLIHQSTRIEHIAEKAVRAQVLKAHKRILQAIRQGDPEAARRRMARHVTAYSEQIEQQAGPGSPADNVTADSSGSTAPQTAQRRSVANKKRATP